MADVTDATTINVPYETWLSTRDGNQIFIMGTLAPNG